VTLAKYLLKAEPAPCAVVIVSPDPDPDPDLLAVTGNALFSDAC
jgi:hypothetical protein